MKRARNAASRFGSFGRGCHTVVSFSCRRTLPAYLYGRRIRRPGCRFTLFYADNEFVALAGGIDAAQADTWQTAGAGCLAGFLYLIFRPFRFSIWPMANFFGFDVEAVFLPEDFEQGHNSAGDLPSTTSQRWLPSRSRRTPLTDFNTAWLAGCCTPLLRPFRSLARLTPLPAKIWYRFALIGVGQIRARYFQIDDFAVLGLVIQFGLVFFAARTCGQADEC